MCDATHAQDWRLVAKVKTFQSFGENGMTTAKDSTRYYYVPGSGRGSEVFNNDIELAEYDDETTGIDFDSARQFSTRLVSGPNGTQINKYSSYRQEKEYDSLGNLIVLKHCYEDTCSDDFFCTYDNRGNYIKGVTPEHVQYCEYDTLNRLIKCTMAYPDIFAKFRSDGTLDTCYDIHVYTYTRSGLQLKDSSYDDRHKFSIVHRNYYDSNELLVRTVSYLVHPSGECSDTSVRNLEYNSSAQLIKECNENTYVFISYSYYPNGKLREREYYHFEKMPSTCYRYTPYGKIASIEECYDNNGGYDIKYFYYELYEPKADAHE